MRLILVRHGETEENVQGISQGWLPGTLSEKGKEQARKVAARLGSEQLDHIYTSDLLRCQDTAEAIAAHHNLPVNAEPAWREMRIGELEGMKNGEVIWFALPGSFMDKKPAGGESIREFQARILAAYQQLEQKHRDETVLLVTHGGVIKCVYALLFSKNLVDEVEGRYENTAVTIIDKGDRTALRAYNCTKHLQESR